MRAMFLCLAVTLAACQPSRAASDQAADPHRSTLEKRTNTSTIIRQTTDRMRTDLGYGISVNKQSAMQREWITVRDSVLPLDFTETVGIRTVYTNDYHYTASFSVRAREPVTAFEVRCTIFDIWGEPVRTLSSTEVEDIPAEQVRTFTPNWNVYSENEVSEHYASICFVARVRTAAGRVAAANMDPILSEGVRFSQRFEPSDLEPRPLVVAGKQP